jgi:hypothetical protein
MTEDGLLDDPFISCAITVFVEQSRWHENRWRHANKPMICTRVNLSANLAKTLVDL